MVTNTHAYEGQLIEEEREFYDDGFDYCTRCDDNGTILICPDDMCRGMGECIHGDGEVLCPNCNGANAL